jgi:hypothetical protein
MGGSKRDDWDAVPLCWGHHTVLHNTGKLHPYDHTQTRNFLLHFAHEQLKLYFDEEGYYAMRRKEDEEQEGDETEDNQTQEELF